MGTDLDKEQAFWENLSRRAVRDAGYAVERLSQVRRAESEAIARYLRALEQIELLADAEQPLSVRAGQIARAALDGREWP